METVGERLNKFVDYLLSEGITTVRQFEMKVGLSNGMLRKMKTRNQQKVNEKLCDKVITEYPILNKNWLMGGMGTMLNLPGGDDLPDDTLLFHYTSLKNFLGIISSGELRSSSLVNSNDPAEKHNSSNYKYLCFCRSGKGHPGQYKARMWSQYGDGNKGVCLEFRLGDFREQIKKQLLDKEIEGFPISYQPPTDKFGNVKTYGFKSKDDLYYKNNDWKEENEYRFIGKHNFSFNITPSLIRQVYLGVYSKMDFDKLSKLGYNSRITPLIQIQGDYDNALINPYRKYIRFDVPSIKNTVGNGYIKGKYIGVEDVSFEEGVKNAKALYQEICADDLRKSFIMDINDTKSVLVYNDVYVTGGDNEQYDGSENLIGAMAIPNSHGAKKFFKVVGCSMEPLINAGDYIGIDDTDYVHGYIDPDKVYMIITRDNQRMIKHIGEVDKKKGRIICVSENKNFTPFPIEFSMIYKVYKVTCCVSVHEF